MIRILEQFGGRMTYGQRVKFLEQNKEFLSEIIATTGEGENGFYDTEENLPASEQTIKELLAMRKKEKEEEKK